MRKRKSYRILSAALCMAVALASGPVVVQAGTWNNALTYYNTYGNSVVFRSTSTTDGIIYYATKASTATTNTRYRTIGWKMTVRNLDGSKLQTIYYKLGGSYMTRVDGRSSSGYEYNLYSMSLYNIKCRLNSKAGKAMDKGEADIVLDACMVVAKNGKAQGAMNDSGTTSGTVYTNYSGISGAASWSSSAMSSLKNYFGKKVDGLFVRITAASDAGVSMVEGEGYYCYGTYVTLKAILRTGYEFEQWSGKTRSTQASISFYATEAGKWIASTTRKKLTLVFHRNLSADDTRYDTQPLAYGDGGTPLQRITWTKNGQELIGWALSADSTTVVYPAKYSVTNELILKSASTLELYAVYGQSVVSVPDTSAIPTSPVTPTTTTPTPGTQTVTSKPDTEILPSNPQPSEDETGTGTEPIRVRFISSKYFEDVSQNLIPQAQGGLAADSKWAVDPALRTLLRRVLSRT